MLELKNVVIQMPHQTLLVNHLIFQQGSISVLMGESGCGKTTLLRYIIGEVKGKGEIFYRNELIKEENRDDFLFSYVGYVDQIGTCFDNMTIYQHFEFYANVHGLCVNNEDIYKYLKIVHLEHVELNQYLNRLSTGERKRVLIALSLMIKKEIMIFDEPMSSLDARNRKELLDAFKKLKDQGKTIIITTHDHDITKISDGVYNIIDGQIKGNEYHIKDEKYDLYQNTYHKINYRKYKNSKLKIIMIVFIIIGSLTCTLLSGCISLTYGSYKAGNQVIDEYQNNTLFLACFNEPQAENQIYDICQLTTNLNEDIVMIDEKDRGNIQNINHVQSVEPFYVIWNLRDANANDKLKDYNVNIYQDDLLLNNLSFTFDKTKPVLMDVFVVEYDDKDIGFEKNNVYINSFLYECLGLNSIHNTKIELTNPVVYDCDDPYNNWFHKTQKILLTVNGISSIEKEEFSGKPYIYAPRNILLEYYQKNAPEYQPTVLKIHVDEGYDDEVQMAIEEMNSCYYVMNQSLTNKEIIDQTTQQIKSIGKIGMIISFILCFAFIGMMIYEIIQRKKEMKKLEQEGLKKYIQGYYQQDMNIIAIISLIFSCLVMFILKGSIVTLLKISSTQLYISWIMPSLAFLMIFMLVRRWFISYMLRKE